MSQKVVLELPAVEFSCKTKSSPDTSNNSCSKLQSLHAVPVIINFQKFLAKPDQHKTIFKGINNKDLLHAVAALYDQSLPEVTEDIIYSSICDKWARTILLVQEYEGALEDYKLRALSKSKCTASKADASSTTRDKANLDQSDIASDTNGEININNNDIEDGPNGSIETKNTVSENSQNIKTETGNSASNPLVLPDPKDAANRNRFENVFSDMESDSDGEEENDEDETDMIGVDDFLKDVQHRKEEHKRWLSMIKENNCSVEPTHLLGIEHRLLGCATFEQSYEKPGQKVIQLTLIATRKRYRKMGVGRYMAKLIRNPVLAGRYDVIVVNSDHSATNFFEREGFSDDPLLNSKYADIGDTWYNCKRMCFLPPYQTVVHDSLHTGDQSKPDIFYDDLEDIDLKQMELDIALYQEKSLQAFQAQSMIIQRLRKEVVLLRARAAAQSDTIKMLIKENHDVRDAKYACEKEFLKLKLSTMTNAADDLLNFDLDLGVSDKETGDT